jgi:cell division protein FtsI/penicillin-binding protein 2
LLKESAWRQLSDALAIVVSSWTGVPAQIKGLDIRGKTGTAQNPGGDDHAWFVAFAKRPGERPAVAVAVLVENGGHGSSVAGPIARSIIMAAYRLEEKNGKVVAIQAPATASPAARPERPAVPAAGVPARTL